MKRKNLRQKLITCALLKYLLQILSSCNLNGDFGVMQCLSAYIKNKMTISKMDSSIFLARDLLAYKVRRVSRNLYFHLSRELKIWTSYILIHKKRQ